MKGQSWYLIMLEPSSKLSLSIQCQYLGGRCSHVSYFNVMRHTSLVILNSKVPPVTQTDICYSGFF